MAKPKNNRVMCPDCLKAKQLFETEKKANMFIEYNKDDIPNGDKLRAYYCPACCGWHITHTKHSKKQDGRTNTLIEQYHKSLDQKYVGHIDLYNELKELGLKTRNAVNKYMRTTDYSEATKQVVRERYYRDFNIK